MRKNRVVTMMDFAQSGAMTQDAYHYQVIAKSIEYIETHRAEHPCLADIAAAAGLSPAHFQRVFTAWAGVSPKKYQQFLTLDFAKSLLRDHHTVLDTAIETGLSGAGRMHDMFVSWEAMSPGEYARRGSGLRIAYDYAASPYGEMVVCVTDRGICGLGFVADCGREAALLDMQARWPLAEFVQSSNEVVPHLPAILGTGPRQLHLMGAPFQIKVWEALLQIPAGAVTTYGDIAAAIGNPKARSEERR